MILTLYYMYATFVQWWRLGALRQRLSGTLNKHNALLLCSSTTCIGGEDQSPTEDAKSAAAATDCKRSLENLLFQHEGRIACTIVPRQTLHLGNWAAFPKDRRSFPLHYRPASSAVRKYKFNSSSKVHLLFQASLERCVASKIDFIKMEAFGELIAWRANEFFEVVVKSDLERLTILMNSFRFQVIGINHDLPLLKVELVDVDGVPGKIKYDHRPAKLQFSHGPQQIQEFAACLRQLFAKINDFSKPKITIENGNTKKSLELEEKKPVCVKKTAKNTLDVHQTAAQKKREKCAKSEHSRDADDESKTKSRHHKVETKSKVHTKTKSKHAEKSTKSTTSLESNEKTECQTTPATVSVSKCEETPQETTKSKDTLVVAKKSYSDVTASPGKNLQRQNATSNSKETSPNRNAKPPNILIYADTSLTRENVKTVLKTIINKNKYTVYDFPLNSAENFWNDTTRLVVVCGQVPAELTPHFLGYLLNGGQLLCLCSDLLYSVLEPFSTAEVREHELVRFTYGEWKRVKMMHHIFCYQASPAKKQFSREASDQSMNGSTGSSPVAPRTPSIVDIQHNGQRHTIQVQVLGAEETWQTPSLLLAAVRGGLGKAVFSQVHLEVDPTQYQDDESKYAALRDSNQARLEILKHILCTHLEIDCSSAKNLSDVQYVPAYFLGRHDLKMDLINGTNIIDGKLDLPDLQLEFFTTNVQPPEAQADRMPIMVLQCPTNFSTVDYFDTLATTRVGRLVIYADVMASSQRLLTSKLCDGLAVIARRQTQGKGRSGNDWLSPEGCAMFSLQLHLPLNSHLGRSVPLVQHLVMLAVVVGVKKASGLQNLEIGLKWPNDLYAYGNIKIGGLVAASTIEQDQAVITIGCGVNLDNREPTICINDMIRDVDKSNAALSPEKFFASAFNEVERIIDETQRAGIEHLLDLYYQHWLHSNANITVSTPDGVSRCVTIKGVDAYGFLLVQDEFGAVSSVQPDGNTFDMLRGLIAPKLT